VRLGWRRKRAEEVPWLEDDEEEAETEVVEEEEDVCVEGEGPREEEVWKGVGSK